MIHACRREHNQRHWYSLVVRTTPPLCSIAGLRGINLEVVDAGPVDLAQAKSNRFASRRSHIAEGILGGQRLTRQEFVDDALLAASSGKCRKRAKADRDIGVTGHPVAYNQVVSFHHGIAPHVNVMKIQIDRKRNPEVVTARRI